MSEDHPRTRGEKAALRVDLQVVLGSPPHTRGKVRKNSIRGCISRITPAHAGKSPFLYIIFHFVEDHPRTRGEKLTNLLSSIMNIGSPPHTRGKVDGDSDEPIRIGITPAHAGKSFVDFINRHSVKDHPRTRGEKLHIESRSIRELGSPPHTRGKADADILDGGKIGITPAHAGKSHLLFPPLLHLRDHPRTRGEK